MRLFSVLFLFASSSAFAATPYDAFIERCGEVAGNGECNVRKYDMSSFDYNKEVRDFLSDIGDNEIPVFKRAEVLDALEAAFAVYQDGQEDLLQEIAALNSKKSKAMFGLAPHPDRCVESEYCSFAQARIYTTDGYLITINFDYNT